MIPTPTLPPAPSTPDTLPRPATRILIFGLPCVGTTWLVNATAQLMQLRGDEPTWLGWWHELEDNQWPEMNAIVRVHAFDPVLATQAHHIFYCVQDLRDAVVATHRAVQRRPDRALADELMQCVEAWESWATEVVVNEQLSENADHYLAHLANALEVSDAVPDLSDLSRSLKKDSTGRTSRSDKTGSALPTSERSAIETAHRPWLERHGYLAPRSPASASATVRSETGAPTGILSDFVDDFRVLGVLKSLGFTPRTVLDVGASTGPWSVTCARQFPHAIYHLVEALPHRHRAMMREPDGRQWFLHELALGASTGTIELTMPTDGYGAYEASALGHKQHGRPIETLTVPLDTIDQMVSDGRLPLPDLVKLDVQGYELEVLRGGLCLWGKTEVFVVETSLFRFSPETPHMHEVIQFFDQRGYQFFDYAGQYRAGPAAVLAQIDLVFIAREGRVARSIKF